MLDSYIYSKNPLPSSLSFPLSLEREGKEREEKGARGRTTAYMTKVVNKAILMSLFCPPETYMVSVYGKGGRLLLKRLI